MIIKNARVFTEDNCFIYGDVSVEAGRFTEVPRTADNCKDDGNKCTWGKATEEGSVKNTYKGNSDGKILDASGLIMIPGLVDIHFHGCRGADMCDGTVEALDVITSYEASVGVTSVCPATMTIPRDELLCVMKNAGDYTYHGGAHLVGINMEGPFISPSKKGAQAAENIMHCDYEYFRQLQDAANGLIKLVDIAPEEPGAFEFIDKAKDEIVISIAHTAADYDTAKEAIEHGASHATHLYNAMPSLHHRNPGVIGAVRDSQKCHVELICDGVHIHPSVIRATFAMFGAERMILISDSMRATGLEDGEYTLGGQPVTVRGNLATLHDGTIAGSATNLMDCMRFAVNEAGISLEEAIMCATANPAKEINIFDEAGSISVGKKADFVLLNNALDIVSVYIDGKEIIC
ncbi:N-acetylglucosamine-6-phosphate deacetylase [Agathobacter rectalis]|uniref:N-acetylglucosamine-6-phosphate deacetylase n=1 Tax=Agathobacter rectalis TaxID=39491 RepID=UPI0027F305A1|nr:N-acetylglucosamine-6-phosphate deacetylase [Agathobacter rectalis]